MIGVATGSIILGLILIAAAFISLNILGFANFTNSFITTIICMIVVIAISTQRRYA